MPVWGSRRLSIRDIEESYGCATGKTPLSGGDQLRGQPSAQPDLPRPVRPLRQRQPVRRARDPRCRRLDPASPDRDRRQSPSPVAAAAAEGGPRRDPGAVLPDVAGPGQAHRSRSTACARSASSSGIACRRDHEAARADHSRRRARHTPALAAAEAARARRGDPDDRSSATALRRPRSAERSSSPTRRRGRWSRLTSGSAPMSTSWSRRSRPACWTRSRSVPRPRRSGQCG